MADRCPYCSFDPTAYNDYCDQHKPDMPQLDLSVESMTWEALEREALYDPVLHAAITLARMNGDQQGAVIAAAIVLSRLHRRMMKREVERIMREGGTWIDAR